MRIAPNATFLKESILMIHKLIEDWVEILHNIAYILLIESLNERVGGRTPLIK